MVGSFWLSCKSVDIDKWFHMCSALILFSMTEAIQVSGSHMTLPHMYSI